MVYLKKMGPTVDIGRVLSAQNLLPDFSHKSMPVFIWELPLPSLSNEVTD